MSSTINVEAQELADKARLVARDLSLFLDCLRQKYPQRGGYISAVHTLLSEDVDRLNLLAKNIETNHVLPTEIEKGLIM
jgi:D-alanyl-D-alanine carboxypeptidase